MKIDGSRNRLNEQNTKNGKTRGEGRGEPGSFDGKVLSRIAMAFHTHFVVLLSWLSMYENAKVITSREELHFGL